MKTPKKKPTKPYHFLMYVEDSNPKIRKFKTTEALGKFADRFMEKYPDYAAHESGNWLEFAATNVSGDLHFFTDGFEVK